LKVTHWGASDLRVEGSVAASAGNPSLGKEEKKKIFLGAFSHNIIGTTIYPNFIKKCGSEFRTASTVCQVSVRPSTGGLKALAIRDHFTDSTAGDGRTVGR
jgi:hypothetical protein